MLIVHVPPSLPYARCLPPPPHAMASRLLHDYPALAPYAEEQLKDLLTHDDLLDAFLYSLPQVQHVLEHQQQLSKENDELASE